MAVYRRSKRHRFVLLLLILTSVTVITLDYRDEGAGALESLRRGARDVLAPVQSATSDALEPVGNFFSGITRYGRLKAENERLRRELDEQRGNDVLAAAAVRERKALLDLVDVGTAGALPSVAARVISTSPSNFQLSVIIDRGTDAKVAVDMPVVTAAGLVGRVVEVSRSRSTVLLLSDRSSNVGVRLLGSGDIGVAKGVGRGEPLAVDLVEVGTKVTPGEAVVTSGLEQSVFPPGIPVGEVRAARTPPGALQQEVTVAPVVDFDRLEFLKVLLWSPQ